MNIIIYRHALAYCILLSSTFGWARVLQQPARHHKPSPSHQSATDELEMEHIEDIESIFHNSATPPRIKRGVRSFTPWRRTHVPVEGSNKETVTSARIPPSLPPSRSNFGWKPISSASSSPSLSSSVDEGSQDSDREKGTYPLPDSPRLVSSNSIVIDPTALMIGARSISTSIGHYVSHGAVSISMAALVYVVAEKVGESIVSRLHRKNNSKYIAELESKLLHIDLEREEERQRMSREFREKLIQTQKEAENNSTLKVEATRRKVVKLAQAKMDELMEKNKKLKLELSKYISLSQRLYNQQKQPVAEDEVSKVHNLGASPVDEIGQLEKKLLEISGQLEQEINNQAQLREDLAQAKLTIRQLSQGQGLDALSLRTRELEEEKRASELMIEDLKQRHQAEILKTTARYEKELLKLKEMVSRAMLVNGSTIEMRPPSPI